MARVALVTDSTSNLPSDLVARRHIYVAPLYILWEEKSYKDGIDMTEDELFRRMVGAKELPKTSQVSPQDFVDLFETARQAESADEVVCAVVSSDLSGTYASAMQAKDNVNFPVRVVDTRQVSWALGFPVLSGADARDAGADANGIVQAIQTAARSTMITFTVETLEYLHRGGRIGNASWLLGSALNIKPVLEVKGGVAEAAGKVRTRKRAIESLLDVAKDRAGGHPIQRVAVIHANVEQEGQELLGQAVKKFSPQESYLSNIAAVVGVHVGPGAIGVIVQWQA